MRGNMPNAQEIREMFLIWTDDGNSPKTLEELVTILDDVVQDAIDFENSEI